MANSSAEDCPFCTIARNYPHPLSVSSDAPSNPDDVSYIVFSSPRTIAFLDRLPLTKCHTLIIPRGHYEYMSDIPPEDAAELGKALPIVCKAVLEVSGADGFNVVQNNGISAGQVVPHAHFHVVPRFREFTSASMFGKGERRELDEDEGIELSRRLSEITERETKKRDTKL